MHVCPDMGILCAGSIYQVLALWDERLSPRGRPRGHVTRFFYKFALIISVESVKLGTSNFVC